MSHLTRYRRRIPALIAAVAVPFVLAPSAHAATTSTVDAATDTYVAEQTEETATADQTETTVDEGDADAQSSATAAEVEGVIEISGTEAKDGEADATALSVFGEEAAGGTQEGDGDSSGSLMDSGETPLGSVAVAAWEATVDGEQSEANSSLVHVKVVDGVADATVLSSSSSRDGSDSQAESDAARVVLLDGEIEVVILHSEAHSDGSGTSYLVRINDQVIADDEQTGEETCPIGTPIADTTLVCTEAIEGGGVTATGLGVDALDGTVVSEFSEASATPEGSPEPDGPEGPDETAPAPVPTPPLAGEPTDDTGSLPRTGASSLLGLLGLGAVALGERLRRAR